MKEDCDKKPFFQKESYTKEILYCGAEKQEAVELLTKYGLGYALRTLDSLQLAAMESVGKANVDWVVCADARFCEVIRLNGFQVINPEESGRNV